MYNLIHVRAINRLAIMYQSDTQRNIKNKEELMPSPLRSVIRA